MSAECDDQDPDPGGGEKTGGENLTFVGIRREVFNFVKGEAQNPNGEESAGSFFLYAMSFQESLKEEKQLFKWCCEIVEYLGIECVLKVGDWRKFGLRDEWPVSPPLWAIEREVEDIEEEVRNGSREREQEVKKLVVENVVLEELKGAIMSVEHEEVTVVESDVEVRDLVELREVMRKGESAEVTVENENVGEGNVVEGEEVLGLQREIGLVEKEVMEELVEKEVPEEMVETVSPILTPGWGGSLLPATCSSPPPHLFSPTGPWRPWEGRKGRKKRKSPSSARRSRNRLLLWQERRDSSRLQAELGTCTTTPHKPASGLVATCLARKFQPGKEVAASPHGWNGTQLAMGGKEFGSQAPPAGQWSGNQTFSPSWSGTQTFPPPWSGNQTFSPSWSGSQTFSPPWSGNQTFSPSPPWPGDQGIVHQGYCLSASTPSNQTMLQQSIPPLVPLPSPIPGTLPPPSSGWTRPANGCTWGTLPALVTTCPSCLAWGLLTPP